MERLYDEKVVSYVYVRRGDKASWDDEGVWTCKKIDSWEY